MEVIRSVETIRNKTKITFESGWQVWFLNRQEFPFPLSEGTEVDRTSFEKTILLMQYPSALDRAVAMLARRPHSKGEISRQLKNAHYDHEVISLVLFKLEKEKLLNDLDFARQWVESRMQKYGANRIRQELRLKEIPPEIIDEVLETATEEEQIQQAAAFVRKKLRTFHASDDRQKVFRNIVAALVRRGFSWETARQAFQIASDTFPEDE